MMRLLRWAPLLLATGAGEARAQLVAAMISYPPKALLAHAEGAIRYQVALSSRGSVTACKVVESSGNAELDRETCRQLRDTALFKPGVDEDGHVRSFYTGVLRWSIPGK